MGISVVSRADVLPVEDVMEKLREVAGEQAATMIGEIDHRGHCSLSGLGLVNEVDRKAEVFGSAYKKLAEWVQGKENEISAATSETREPKISATGQIVGGTSTTGSTVNGDGLVSAQTADNAVGGGAVEGGRGCGWLLCSWWRRSHNSTPAPAGTGVGTASGGGATSGNVTGGVLAAPLATASNQASAGERSFERDMVLASRQRGSEAREWAWVRRVNKDKWQKFLSPRPTTMAVSV